MRLVYFILFLLINSFILQANTVLHLKISDAISPGTHKYFQDSFLKAKNVDAKIILVELDTPGGLVTTTREMVKEILNSNIPVVMYVSPKGSRAASAGTFLMYASHISAMAPSTNIGAATPVNIGGIEKPKDSKNKKESQNNKAEKALNAMEKKIINDTVAYIKSIAEHRNRNIEWAIEAVKEGKSISALEAKEKKVIDIVANNINELLENINGFKVNVNDKEITIDTTNTTIFYSEATWKTEILMLISNPNIAYAFLILGFYGILFEMMNPGSVFPGVIGSVSALIALYALNILPFSYTGLLLIFLGIILMLIEITMIGFGILGIAGAISFALGSLLLFDEKILGVGVSYPILIAFTVVSIGIFSYLFRFLFKTRKTKSNIGLQNFIGKKAVVKVIENSNYKVEVDAEIWNANSDEKFNLNDEVLVENIEGLNLKIRSL